MPSPNCNFCSIIAERGVGLLYEDKHIAAFLHKMPSTVGHILLLPKEHYPILEQVPDYIVTKLFVLANKMSTLLFDSFNIQGTNILVANGIEAGQEAPHAMVNVISRVEGDGLSMQWQPRQISEEEMGTIELLLKEECKGIGDFEQEPKEVLNLDIPKQSTAKAEEGKTAHGESKGHENYLLKHIRRIP